MDIHHVAFRACADGNWHWCRMEMGEADMIKMPKDDEDLAQFRDLISVHDILPPGRQVALLTIKPAD